MSCYEGCGRVQSHRVCLPLLRCVSINHSSASRDVDRRFLKVHSLRTSPRCIYGWVSFTRQGSEDISEISKRRFEGILVLGDLYASVREHTKSANGEGEQNDGPD